MAEVTELAYEDLRFYVEQNWNRIELLDDEDERVISINSTNNDKANWIHQTKQKQVGWDDFMQPIYADVPDTAVLKMEVVLTGADLTLPATISKSVIKNQDEKLSIETFEPVTLTQPEDEITIIHSIEIPKID